MPYAVPTPASLQPSSLVETAILLAAANNIDTESTQSSHSSEINTINALSAEVDSTHNQPGTSHANGGPHNSTLSQQFYDNNFDYGNTQANQMYPQQEYSQTNMNAMHQPYAQNSSYSMYDNSARNSPNSNFTLDSNSTSSSESQSSNDVQPTYQPNMYNECTGSHTQQNINNDWFDPTVPKQLWQQQQEIVAHALPLSLAKLSSSTTEGLQDDGLSTRVDNQQSQYELPSSSSVGGHRFFRKQSGKLEIKCTEKREIKCTTCNKCFVSFRSLKIHNKTPLHKNAVYSRVSPDPATIGESKRGEGASTATNGKDQQPLHLVQPSESLNSPQNREGSLELACSLTVLPNFFGAFPLTYPLQQQQQQQQQQQNKSQIVLNLTMQLFQEETPTPPPPVATPYYGEQEETISASEKHYTQL